MSTLKLHNSLTRQKEVFTPIDPDHVRIYACGPTVYNYAHIGNARMAVVFDVLANVLRALYPKVTYVSNITDVDDKIITASRNTGEAISDITQKYTKIYNQDMASLGVREPDVQPLATEHIGQMIAIIEDLIAKDHAYAADGHVLFHVPSFEKYGGLSGRNRDEQIAGARVEVASYKKDPADFVLWKPSNDDEPDWDSPWGKGRPGWHIECSAMAAEHLGLPFDIHGGGADLKFPHHENEIAQSCCAHGDKDDLSSFAKYWVHNGFVTVEGEKMSKSLGNITLVHELIDREMGREIHGEIIRMALLTAHYRQPLDWSDSVLNQCTQTLIRIYKLLNQHADIENKKTDIRNTPFIEALLDDLNTPKALAELNAIAGKLKKAQTDDEKKYLKEELLAAGAMLGILQEKPNAFLNNMHMHVVGWTPEHGNDHVDTGAVEKMLQERGAAKAVKDFATADKIRDELLAMGVAIEDTPNGAVWKKI